MEDAESHEVDSGHVSSAGEALRSAREKAGLSRADVASQTKIAERHLESIEDDRFADLAARTYAVGFSRAYARAVGLDEKVIADKVRAQLDADDSIHAPTIPSFEPGDPARVPPLRLAWMAAGGAILVIGLLVFFWSSFFSPEGRLPSLLPEDAPSQTVASQPAAPAPAPALSAVDGPVVLTAKADRIWVKVTDADGEQLFQKELANGESWTVPAGAKGALLRTGRPDALTVTVGGKPIAALPDTPVLVSGVSLTPADLRARAEANANAAPASPASSAPAPAPRAEPGRAPAVPSSPTASPTSQASPSPRPSRTASAPVPGPSASPRPSASASARPTVRPTPSPTRTALPAPTSPAPGATPSAASSPVATPTAPLSTVSD